MRNLIAFRKVSSSFASLSPRERIIVGLVGVVIVVLGVRAGIQLVDEHLENSRRLAIARKTQLQDVAFILKRYASLRGRKDALQATFERSQMSFEQVSTELDRIVREAIGSDNYELKRPHPPESFGFEYEKQEFSLIINGLSLEQLVKLLHQIEYGDRPIFLSKIDINKGAAGTDFRSVLGIFSISKTASANRPAES